MGQIYEKKETTDVVQSSFRVTQLANNVFDNTEELKRNAEREKAEAFDVYSKGLHLSASQSMADMFNENQNDPEKLQEMFNGLNDKMSAEIPDIETKIGFKADFLVESQSYLNRARSNQKRIRLIQQREQNEQMMVNWSNMYSNSFYNMLTPDSTVDDVVNFVRSRDGIENTLSARNEDGTLIYSPLQQERIRDSLRKVQTDSIKSYFNDLPDYEKVNFYNDLSTDNVLVKSGMISQDDKEEIFYKPLSTFMDQNVFREIKSYTKDYMTKIEENDYLSPEEANIKAIENLVAINEHNFLSRKGRKGKDRKGHKCRRCFGLS